MNEKIRELALQTVTRFDKDMDGSMEPEELGQWVRAEELEKFAELIVRECAKFLDENSGYDDANNAWHPEPEELLEHFGVSE